MRRGIDRRPGFAQGSLPRWDGDCSSPTVWRAVARRMPMLCGWKCLIRRVEGRYPSQGGTAGGYWA
ncbi:hypothetical protein F750_1021 [Streptomyces sp. PAMC 26508]|nr:hypothetical protein F750_1021 [Streptomyces sp. PAMC 26508]